MSDDAADGYELLDLGGRRRLERFGAHVIDRPAGAAAAIPVSDPELWEAVTARYEPGIGWVPADALPAEWRVRFGALTLELRAAPSGQLGVFPEQAATWAWLGERLGGRAASEPPRILNLFAYTGGSTLEAATAGAEVVHVDAARNVVAWARRNAALSGLQDAPIHWIAEDAQRFVEREIRRGRRYAGVVLDPPSFGRAPGHRTWKLVTDLDALLGACARLTGERPLVACLTAHTSGFDADDAARAVARAWPAVAASVERGRLAIPARDGRLLEAGVYARVAT